ncbi:YihY/virulence factor BrkB family protein [Novosphingobium sp. PhB55]|uniref:YihY/virulence factor BrkB family protein n=1 Tax=Novosphingobium sp. PhB55 TaxID=2485106 RepID=UPI001FBC08D1|nr:YihY/virulence factor BrkB family protein [Novosphingobium sp. PhB55]
MKSDEGTSTSTVKDEMSTQSAPKPLGTDANAPWQIPGRAWWKILKRVYVMSGFHELGLLSAGLAFYCFLALTPLIGATVMIYGLFGNVETVHAQMQSIVEVVPPEVARMLEQQLVQIVTTSRGVTGFALLIALFFAIFGGMRAANGMISALNIINEERETRGTVSLTLRAVGLTVSAVLIALTGVLSGGVFAWLQTQTSVFLGDATAILFKWLTWVAAVALGSGGFALIMRYGPDRSPAKWRWLAPGSLLATLLWIAVSFGFSLYVAYISDYNATYGSLSAIVVFLMWLYLSAYGVLLGALVNAEIERQTFCDTTTGPSLPAGERGAVLADVIDNRVPSPSELDRHKRRKAEQVRGQVD